MDASAGEPGARLRVKGRRPLLAAMVTDSMGTGMFLPFTVLYFVHTAGLTAPASIYQLSWSVGQTIAPAVLLGLLSAGPRWLWATTISLCLAIILSIHHLTPAPATATTTRNPER